MPRKPRSACDAEYHHVYSRGVAKQRIFHTVADVLAFLGRLAEALVSTGAKCLSWAVMRNHYHLVLACSAEVMGLLMHRTLGPYASRYNSVYERSGHLFGNRYGSVPIYDEIHLKGEIRYAIRNPHESGVVPSVSALERYPWTGFPTLLGTDGPVPMAVDFVLGLFGATVDSAREALREWVAIEPARAGETGEEAAVRVIASDVCAAHGLRVDDLKRRAGPRVKRAREIAVNAVRERVRATDALIARVLGLSRSTLSRIPRDR